MKRLFILSFLGLILMVGNVYSAPLKSSENQIGELTIGLDNDTKFKFPKTDGASGQALLTDGDGTLTWTDVPSMSGYNKTQWDDAYSKRVDTWTAPLVFSNNTVSIPSATASRNGYLTSTDFSHFVAAYGWGNHATQNYYDKDTDTADDIVDGSTNVIITSAQETNFTTAYTHSQNDGDTSATNEIQDLSLSGDTLSLSGDATTVDLSSYLKTVAFSDLTGNPSDVITAGTGIEWSGDTLNVTAIPTTLTIKDVDGSPSISNVNTIEFDSATGLNVTNPSANTARITLSSSFNPWTVSGQDQLDATGEEEIELIAGTGMSIETDILSTPKSITFSTTAVPEWGSITGTLADQTDLQSALDAKQSTVSAGTNISIDGATINGSSDDYIQDTAWKVLNSPYSHLLVEYNSTTNLVDFTIDEDLANYTWDNVTDAHIPDTLTIGADSVISEDAIPDNVIFIGEIDSKSELDAIVGEALLSENTEFSGDVSGTYSSMSVDKIIGITVDDTDLSNGTIMQFNSATGNFEFTDPSDYNLGLYAGTFTDAELSLGVLTIAHAFNLDANYKISCTIYDNNDNMILSDDITIIDKDNITVDLSSYGTISGTWKFVVMGDGATAVPRSIIVQESDGDPSASNVTTLKFNQDTGFNITDEGGGIVEVSLGSHWKDLQVDGQDTLTPEGEETLELIAGSNVTIETDSESIPQSIIISATGAGGASDNITEGDTKVETIDTGDGRIEFTEDDNLVATIDNERLTIENATDARLELQETTTDYLTYFEKNSSDHEFSLISEQYNADLLEDFAIDLERDNKEFILFNNGLDGYISFPFSISVTVNLESLTTDGDGRTPNTIVGTDFQPPSGSELHYGFKVQYFSNGSVCIESGNQDAGGMYPYRRWVTTSGLLSTGTTKHILAVWRAYNDVDVFVNGIEYVTNPPAWYPGSGTTVASSTTYGPIIGSGRWYTDGGSRFIDGIVDEVAFFNADKSSSIETFYSDGAPQAISVGESNLIFLARLNEGTGAYTTDSKTGLTGTHYHWTGSWPFVTNSSGWVEGLISIADAKGIVEVLNITDEESGAATVTLSSNDLNAGTYGNVVLDGASVIFKIEGSNQMYVASDGGLYLLNVAIGTTQVASGAEANEVWADSDDDYTLKLGQ